MHTFALWRPINPFSRNRDGQRRNKNRRFRKKILFALLIPPTHPMALHCPKCLPSYNRFRWRPVWPDWAIFERALQQFLFTKVAQLFIPKLCCAYFVGNLWKNLGIWSRCRRPCVRWSSNLCLCESSPSWSCAKNSGGRGLWQPDTMDHPDLLLTLLPRLKFPTSQKTPKNWRKNSTSKLLHPDGPPPSPREPIKLGLVH